ncbi:hypothetical protein MBLNU459_g2492t1 [Dothideomycetes sp. NU459]
MSKGLLITGATGKQGGATVDALVASATASTDDITILAVTRNPASASAAALASKADNIKLVKGDMNDVPALFAAARATHPSIHGVFSVQTFAGSGQTAQTEEAQGKALVDGALAHGVKQFVYTSVERGRGAGPTNVPHFISKHNVERHLIEQTRAAGDGGGGGDGGGAMQYTILRPVAFMENLTPDVMGKVFGAALTVGLGGKSLQFVSVVDIGHFAAQAFLRPENYANRAIGLAGDDLTRAQMDDVFREKTGKPAPTTWGVVGSGLLWGVKEVGVMMKWFKDEGYEVKIADCRKEHPGMLDLGKWLETKSAFKTIPKQ